MAREYFDFTQLHESAQETLVRHGIFTINPNSVITRKGDTELLKDYALSASPSTPSLHPAWQNQEKTFASAFSILEEAIVDRVFPAASIAVTNQSELVALKAFGNFVYEGHLAGISSLPRGVVTPATLFDLASLTKVVATTSMAMLLYQQGVLDLEVPIAGVLPEFLGDRSRPSDPRREQVSFHMLLAHSSGLPAYEKLFLEAKTRDEVVHAALTTPLIVDPGARADYSDIGFILLGIALERLAGESLDQFCQREIFGPLGMTSTAFNPSPPTRAQIPPTLNDREFRHRVIQGEVHDENAFLLGGVAGHAGLFSVPEDLAKFAHAILQGRTSILLPETISHFTRRETRPAGTSRALGWDTPSDPSQSGKYFQPGSFGHLGYTGTSLWLDPVRRVSITLLTNRTWPDGSNQAIKQLRPRFHDAIGEAIANLL